MLEDLMIPVLNPLCVLNMNGPPKSKFICNLTILISSCTRVMLMNMIIIGVAKILRDIGARLFWQPTFFWDQKILDMSPGDDASQATFFLMQNFFWPLWHLGSRLGLFVTSYYCHSVFGDDLKKIVVKPVEWL